MLAITFEQLAEVAEMLGGRPRIENGRYFIHWGNDEGVLWFWPTVEDGVDKVMAPFIQSPRPGTLGGLTGTYLPWLAGLGYASILTAASADEHSLRWLLGMGFEQREDGMLEGSLDSDSRFWDYWRWKCGGNEPEWHKDVVLAHGPGRTEA